MLSKLMRVLFALTAVAPLSVSLAYVFLDQHRYVYAIAAGFACFAFALVAREILMISGRRLERLAIKLQKAKSADKEVIGFFVAYALPIVFRGSEAPELGTWLFAAAMLLFVLWSTHSLQVNPILTFVGFHFYEVETTGGITYLLVTRRRINDVLSVVEVVQLSEHGVLEV